MLSLNREKLTSTCENLNGLLSEYSVFYMNVRGFHWNIKGRQFFTLHEKFEELYNDLQTKIDEIAERILILGFQPLHAYSRYLEQSNISEATDISGDEAAVQHILESLQQLLHTQRKVLSEAEKVGDEGTVDMMAGYIKDFEMLLWQYSSFIEN